MVDMSCSGSSCAKFAFTVVDHRLYQDGRTGGSTPSWKCGRWCFVGFMVNDMLGFVLGAALRALVSVVPFALGLGFLCISLRFW